MNNEEFGSVSAFYLALWAHLDALSDRSRWLRASETATKEEREAELSAKLKTLKNMKLDWVLMSSISNEYEKTLHLVDEYTERGEIDIALRHEVEEWKAAMQNFGLEFARLEALP